MARFHRRQRAIQPTQETLGSEQLRVRISMGLEDPKDTDLLFGSAAARHGITLNHCAWSFHPPCAALGTITAAGSGTTLTDPEREGS